MDHFFSVDDEYNDSNEVYNEKISLDELYDRKKEVEEKRFSIYKKILGRVHTKIRQTARQKHNEQYLFFVVPEFVFGIPKYDVSTCISFIIDKLTENGFAVKYTHPNLLFISWMHYIPAYQRERIRLETGVSVDGFGNVITKKKGAGDVRFQNDDSDDENDPKNFNNLILKTSKSLDNSTSSSSKQKEYRDIGSYRPSGLIYNQDLLKKLNDKFS